MSKPLASEFATQGEQYLGTSYKTMDCQAFVEKMLNGVGIRKNWRGSNAMYRDMAWVGSPEDCKEKFGRIPVGVFLFIHDHDDGEPSRYKADGLGNASHVGVKTGTGEGAIHSSASRGCVAESKFADKTIRNGGWNTVGFCKLLDYGSDIEAILYGEPEPDSDDTESESEMIHVNITTAQVKTTNGGSLNLRSTPAKTSRNRICGIPDGTALTVLEKTSDDWWKVRYNSKTGYVATEYLLLIDQSAETADGTISLVLDLEVALCLRDALNNAIGGTD